MRVGGFIDISTKDIPGLPCMVMFTVGCNFKCEFCHNKYLLQPNIGREISISELVKQATSNVVVNGISITGGEPTLQKDLLDLCIALSKELNYISIDTNGSHPEVIQNLIPYINRIALDMKGPFDKERLKLITGVQVEMEKIKETINLVNNIENFDFEIRTTYVEPLLVPKDIDKMLKFLEDTNFHGNFVLQQYQYSEGVGEDLKEKFRKPEHITLLEILKPHLFNELPFTICLRDDIIGFWNTKDLRGFYD